VEARIVFSALSSNVRLFGSLLLLILIILLIALALPNRKKAPSFSVKTPDGKILSLSTESEQVLVRIMSPETITIKGNIKTIKPKLVVIVFWATYCKACNYLTQQLQKLHDKYSKRGLLIIGINEDKKANRGAARRYIEQKKLTYINVFDSSLQLQFDFSVSALPTQFILDSKGWILHRIEGTTAEADELKEVLSKLGYP